MIGAFRGTGLLWLVDKRTGEMVPRDLAQYAAMGRAALGEYLPPFFDFEAAERFADGIRARP